MPVSKQLSLVEFEGAAFKRKSLRRHGKDLGAIPIEQLKKMVSAGVIGSDTEAREPGSDKWLTVGDLLNAAVLASDISAEPPAPPPATPPGTAPAVDKSPFAPNQITDTFGLTIDTPIPASSIPASTNYLRHLATPDLKRVKTQHWLIRQRTPSSTLSTNMTSGIARVGLFTRSLSTLTAKIQHTLHKALFTTIRWEIS